jgi:hypothetical protein
VRWLIDASYQPFLLTACGDLFLRNRDGAVFWLDMATGALHEVARSLAGFAAAARLVEHFDEWLMPKLAFELNAAHGLLPHHTLRVELTERAVS